MQYEQMRSEWQVQSVMQSTPPNSFRRRRLRFHGDLVLGPPVVQPDCDRVRHDDVVRLARRPLLRRRSRGQPLGRDRRRRLDGERGLADDDVVVVADAGREVDALVLRRWREDQAAVWPVAVASLFPRQRPGLSPASGGPVDEWRFTSTKSNCIDSRCRAARTALLNRCLFSQTQFSLGYLDVLLTVVAARCCCCLAP